MFTPTQPDCTQSASSSLKCPVRDKGTGLGRMLTAVPALETMEQSLSSSRKVWTSPTTPTLRPTSGEVPRVQGVTYIRSHGSHTFQSRQTLYLGQ